MAGINLLSTTKKLIAALRLEDVDVVYGTKQFKSRDGRFMTLYTLSLAVWNDERCKYTNVEIYRSGSPIRIILYLRDMLFTKTGKELPNDSLEWCRHRVILRESGDKMYENWRADWET